MTHPRYVLGSAALILLTISTADAIGRSRDLDHGVVHLTLPSEGLAELGLAVASTFADADGATYELPLDVTDLHINIRDDAVASLDAGDRIPMLGGVAFRAWNPATNEPQRPGFLFDASVEIRGTDHLVRFHVPDPTVGVLLEARGATLTWDTGSAEARIRGAEVVIAAGWAEAMGRPELAGRRIGSLDVTLGAIPVRTEAPARDFDAPRGGPILDVSMFELYGLQSMEHSGAFPNGLNGLSATTTSCNVGEVDLPWFGAMAEDHPFIGLAMYREENGRLEQIGRNWIKHGFFAVNDDQCIGCTNLQGGNTLWIGCSDTYSANNNGDYFHLGPREEVNPHTGIWVACGSYFDEPVTPDLDCNRNWFGFPSDLTRQLAVSDADLNHPAATYYYEGLYVVKDDDNLVNNIGWRRLATLGWSGSQWSFATFNEDPLQWQDANQDALVLTWGDTQTQMNVAGDDGLAMIAADVTDLGTGWWRYEYALYNRSSARAIHSFSIPTAAATRAVTFRDLDTEAGNDWTITTTGGAVTWATDDFATDPNANVLEYQMLFNLGFEADQRPTTVGAAGGLYRPGLGTSFVISTSGPDVPTNGIVAGRPLKGLDLKLAGPNPGAHDLRVSLAIPREGHVRLVVRDVSGRRVRTLLDGRASAGVHMFTWDGRDGSGQRAANGVYFFRMETSSGVRTIKATLIR